MTIVFNDKLSVSVHFLSLKVKSCCIYSMEGMYGLSHLYLLSQASSSSFCTKHLTGRMRGYPPAGGAAGWALKNEVIGCCHTSIDAVLFCHFLAPNCKSIWRITHSAFWKTTTFSSTQSFFSDHICVKVTSSLLPWEPFDCIQLTLETSCSPTDISFLDTQIPLSYESNVSFYS